MKGTIPCQAETLHPAIPAIREPTKTPPAFHAPPQTLHSRNPPVPNPCLPEARETRRHVERNPSMKIIPCQPETLPPAIPAILEPTKTPPSMPSKCASPALQKPARAQPMPTRSPVPNTGCHREARHHVKGNPCMKAIFYQPETLHPAKPTIRDPTKTTPACHSHAPAQHMHTRKPVSNKPCHRETRPRVERNPSMTMMPCQLEILHPAIPAIREPTKTPPSMSPT